MKSALFALTALFGIAIGVAAMAPASAEVSTAPYTENTGGGNG